MIEMVERLAFLSLTVLIKFVSPQAAQLSMKLKKGKIVMLQFLEGPV